MRRLSLRGRLVLGVVMLTALGLLLTNVAVFALFRSFEMEQVDGQLVIPGDAGASTQISGWLSQVCGQPGTAQPTQIQMPTSYAVAIVDDAGVVKCSLPDSAASDLRATLGSAALADAAATGTIITLRPEHGPPTWRARVIAIDGGYAVLARSLADVTVALGRLASLSLTVSIVILAATTLIGFLVVRIGLRPLTRIQQTAEEIAAGDMSLRVDEAPARTEVGRLGRSFNTMLARIEQAFAERDRTEERLRRFVADAGHELRTPLSTIRGHAELLRTGVASTPSDVDRAVGRIESESVRMTRLVDDLLLLARLDAAMPLESRQVDLLSVAVDAVADTRARAPERSITVQNPVGSPWDDEPPTVLGDDARLQQVVANLLGNAVQHTPDGTPIEVEVGVRDKMARLNVVDHGPGLQAGNEQRAFERFFREDPGRSRAQGGAGLGLAIAWSLVDRQGGTLTYRPTPGGGATFEVALPVTEG